MLKDGEWAKWIGRGRGCVTECVYDERNESLEGKWGEIGRERAMPQTQRERDGDGKPERAQMRELRWWAGSFQAPGCFSGLSSTLRGIVWNAQADGWHISHESSMSGHCPLRFPRKHTPLHKCVCTVKGNWLTLPHQHGWKERRWGKKGEACCEFYLISMYICQWHATHVVNCYCFSTHPHTHARTPTHTHTDWCQSSTFEKV